MKMKCRYIVLFLLVFSMAFGSTNTVKVQAAKTRLSKETITLYKTPNPYVNFGKLEMKNVKSKVNWSSSNKKLVQIKQTSGKYRETAILAAKKTGSCKITATVDGRKYVCKVKVKRGKAPTGVTGVTVENVQKISGAPWGWENESEKQPGWSGVVYGTIVVDVLFKNYTSGKIEIPAIYKRVEKLIDGEWVDVTSKLSYPVAGCGYGAYPETEVPHTYYVYFMEEDAANFESGTYRLKLDYYDERFPYSPQEKVQFIVPFTLE